MTIASDLQADFRAYWNLYEESGNRADATGRGNTLTPTDMASAATWGRPSVAKFDATPSYLDGGSTADLQLGDRDWSAVAEVEMRDLTQNYIVFAKVDATAGTTGREYRLEYRSDTNKFRFSVFRPTNSSVSVEAATPSPAIAGKRYFICVFHDAANDLIGISVNNATATTGATGGALQSAGTDPFRIGWQLSTSEVTAQNGLIRRVGIMHRLMTTNERDWLYNSGIGRDWPFTAPAPSTGDQIVTDAATQQAHNLAGNANISPFRSGIASVSVGGTDYQVFAYANSASTVVIGKRELPSGAWTFYVMDGTGGRPTMTVASSGDSHNHISVGLDPDGYIHVVWDHDGDPLNYRRSNAPISSWTGAMGDATSMTGAGEGLVSSTRFWNRPDTGALMFANRDIDFSGGGSDKADYYLKEYDHEEEEWNGATGTSTGGLLMNGADTPASPYWGGAPWFDSDFGSGGFMHAAWHWRVSGTTGAANQKTSYFKWDGTNFLKADGTAQTVPITIANCEIIDDIGPNAGINRLATGDSDGDGNSCAVHLKTDGSGYQNLFAYRHIVGDGWQTPVQVTTGENVFDRGLANSAPQIVIDRQTGRHYFLLRGYGDERMFYLWTDDFQTFNKVAITDADVGDSSPEYDRNRWLRDGELDMPIFFDEQVRMHTVELVQPSPSLSVLDAEENPVANGETTPINIGSATVGGQKPSYTVKIENNGDAVLNIASVNVPEGFAVAAGSQVPAEGTTIDADAEKTLTLELLTDEIGTPSGNVVIANDDPETGGEYTWAISGTVAPGSSGAGRRRRMRLLFE